MWMMFKFLVYWKYFSFKFIYLQNHYARVIWKNEDFCIEQSDTYMYIYLYVHTIICVCILYEKINQFEWL